MLGPGRGQGPRRRSDRDEIPTRPMCIALALRTLGHFAVPSALVALLAIASGCDSDDDGDSGDGADTGGGSSLPPVDTGLALPEFLDIVEDAAGPDAEACGAAAAGASPIEVNTCLAQAFGNATDAWGIFYPEDGTTFTAAQGLVTSGGGVVSHTFVDVRPDGRGRAEARRCVDARLSGTVDGTGGGPGPFLCDGFDSTTVETSGDPVEPMPGGPGAPDEPTPVTNASLLVGPTWVWNGYRATPGGEVEPVPTGPRYSIRFASADGGETGSYTGTTDCNDYGGSYASDGILFETVPGPMTDSLCEDPAMTEARFLGTLATAAAFGFEDDRLILIASDGAALFFTDDADSD